jgi:hypothetical protein
MITQIELKKLLHFDDETGAFTWLVNKGKVKRGASAGTVNKNGYIYITLNQERYLAHRLAWLYVYGEWPARHIDHINHERTSNGIWNLRDVTNQINHMNKSMRPDNKSGITGVSWDAARNKWRAAIKLDGKCVMLGRFATKKGAAKIRKEAEIKYGYHKNHGDAPA